MEAGQIVEYYPNWIARKGNAINVELIDFIDYEKRSSGHVRIVTKDDKKYIGEVWLCRVNGENISLVFRQDYDPDDIYTENSEVGWDFNKSPIRDDLANPIVDSFEEVRRGFITSNRINVDLIDEQKRTDCVDFELKQIIKDKNIWPPELVKTAQVRLDFRTRTSMRTYRSWQAYKLKYPQRVTDLIRFLKDGN